MLRREQVLSFKDEDGRWDSWLLTSNPICSVLDPYSCALSSFQKTKFVAGLQGVHRCGGCHLASNFRLPQADLSGDATGGGESTGGRLRPPGAASVRPSCRLPRTSAGTATPSAASTTHCPAACHLAVVVHVLVVWNHNLHHDCAAPRRCIHEIRSLHLQFVQLQSQLQQQLQHHHGGWR